ncbi:hypothetical protein BTURTLESOX_1354 [bacterium endosymbiont of Bathymodiolus sp. 5 South]|nr:hypothetical protein BTURTLESOX_1354 [bacterium endosymbiont of Bathymodiolus sp. 5 South]
MALLFTPPILIVYVGSPVTTTVSLRVTVTIILSPILSVLVLPAPVAFVARIATLLTLVCMITSFVIMIY